MKIAPHGLILASFVLLTCTGSVEPIATAQVKNSVPPPNQANASNSPIKRNEVFINGITNRSGRSVSVPKDSPIGQYDAVVIDTIKTRWNQLIRSPEVSQHEKKGKATLKFHLYPDGKVQKVLVVTNTLDLLHLGLCQKAILDSAPYPEWPAAMKMVVTAPYGEVRFTFFVD